MANRVIVSISLCVAGVVIALAAPRPDPQQNFFSGLPLNQLPIGNFSSITDYNEYLTQAVSLYQNQTANIPFASAVNPSQLPFNPSQLPFNASQLPFNPSQLPFNPSQLPNFPNLGGGGGDSGDSNQQAINLSNMLAYNEYLTQVISLYQNQTANIPVVGGGGAGSSDKDKDKKD